MKSLNFNTKRMKEIVDRMKKSTPSKKSPTMSEMIGSMRRLLKEEIFQNPQTAMQQSQQDVPATQARKLGDAELDIEKQKFENVFRNYNVAFEYEPLLVIGDAVIWGGTIDGQIQWIYKVSDEDNNSGVEMNFAPDFNPDEGDNKKIIDLIESYYSVFFKFWRENQLELDNQ